MSDTKQQCPEYPVDWHRGRLFQFNRMKNVRPADPIYWDDHEERSIREAIDSPVEGSGEPTSSGSKRHAPEAGTGTQTSEGALSVPLPDSPGAQEFTLRNRGQQFADDYCSAEIYDLMQAYADHLREQVDDLRRQRDLEWDSRKRAQSELTAERTRREAAERVLEEISKQGHLSGETLATIAEKGLKDAQN